MSNHNVISLEAKLQVKVEKNNGFRHNGLYFSQLMLISMSYEHNMWAMTYDRYGSPDIFNLKQVSTPSIKDDEVLVKIHSSSINTPDIFFRSGITAFFGMSRFVTGIRRPKMEVLGWDVAGEIVKVGDNVTDLVPGDRVFGGVGGGAHAEYARAKPKNLAKLNEKISFEEAGVMPMSALSSLQGLRNAGEIKQNQDVLIYGASSGLGTFGVQIAKYYGTHVTGVASGKNEQIVRDIGADDFIDYTKRDFTAEDTKYDIVFDCVGRIPLKKWSKALKPEGRFVNAGSPNMSILGMFSRVGGNRFRSKKIRSFNQTYNTEDLDILQNMVSKGKMKSIIDVSYPIAKLSEAHRYYELRKTVGKVHIKIDFEETA